MITGSSDQIKWTKHPNYLVVGGQDQTMSTLDSCKTQCVDNSNCTGFIWNERYSMCSLHGPWSAGNSMTPYSGIDYYELTRNVAQTLNSTGKCHASLDLICTVDAKIFTIYQKETRSSATA